MQTIQQNGKRYYIVEKTGDKLPSITTILSHTSDKTFLENWKKRIGQEEADKQSVFSSNRGTYMHSLLENYIKYNFIDKLENSFKHTLDQTRLEFPEFTDVEVLCGKKLFMQFFNEMQFFNQIKSVKYQEIPIWSFIGGGFAGRMDLVVIDNSDKLKIVDFKTSKKPKLDNWVINYKKQISAYAIALKEQTGEFPDSCEIWISCESGEVQLFELSQKDIKYWFTEFYKDVKTFHKMFNKPDELIEHF